MEKTENRLTDFVRERLGARLPKVGEEPPVVPVSRGTARSLSSRGAGAGSLL